MSCTASFNYSLVVETVTQSYSDAWAASIVCKMPAQLVTQSETSTTVKNQMIASYNALDNVNFASLSSSMGLSYTFNQTHINFNAIKRSYINDDCNTGEAIMAPFNSNTTNNNEKYYYMLSFNNSSYTQPMIVRISLNKHATYYELNEGVVTAVSNLDLTTPTVSITQGTYRIMPRMGCAINTANCIGATYVRGGTRSAILWAFSAIFPEAIGAVGAVCAVKHCLLF